MGSLQTPLSPGSDSEVATVPAQRRKASGETAMRKVAKLQVTSVEHYAPLFRGPLITPQSDLQ